MKNLEVPEQPLNVSYAEGFRQHLGHGYSGQYSERPALWFGHCKIKVINRTTHLLLNN